MKVYSVEKTLKEGVILRCNNEVVSIERSLKLRNHSPTGFGFGYGGSGPAQLALAILLDALDDEAAALEHYQCFKQDVVAQKMDTYWAINEEQIRAWVETHKAEVAAKP